MSLGPGRETLARLLGGAATAFDALVPVSCVHCRRGVAAGGAPLCLICASRLKRLPSPRCVRCAEPLGSSPGGFDFDRCGTCEMWPDCLSTAGAPYIFGGVAASVVRGLKYQGWRSLAPLMAEHMLPSIREVTGRVAPGSGRPLLVPVPLTPSRHRERGFNQADDLVRALAELGAGRRAAVLARQPGGKRQAGARGALRRVNVQGRFRALEPARTAERPAIVVDDVLTTGATAIACGAALDKAGFRRVATVSFARTVRPLGEGT